MYNQDFYKGVANELVRLWSLRDDALAFEKKTNAEPRTSKQYLKAQAEIDNYFLPPKNKAIRKKPKVKVYSPDPDWAY
jgi:hypothetical protein